MWVNRNMKIAQVVYTERAKDLNVSGPQNCKIILLDTNEELIYTGPTIERLIEKGYEIIWDAHPEAIPSEQQKEIFKSGFVFG